MSSGTMFIGREKVKPCKVKVESKHTFRITLTQGLNRQIRQMCLQIGYNVSDLMRVRIMHIPLGVLKLGRWRNLSDVELDGFFKS